MPVKAKSRRTATRRTSIPRPAVASPSPPPPPPIAGGSDSSSSDFGDWALHNGLTVSLSTLISLLTGTLLAILRLIGALKFDIFRWSQFLVYFVQATLIAVALTWSFARRKTRDKVINHFPREIRDVIWQFSFAWLALLLVWLVTYSGYTIQEFARVYTNGTSAGNPQYAITGFVMMGLSLAETACYYWMYSVVSMGARTRHQGSEMAAFPAACGFAVVAVCMLSGSPLFREAYAIVPLLLMQSLLSISMAMLIGRLDSRFIGVSTALLIFLYMYAAIQPAYAFAVILPFGQRGPNLPNPAILILSAASLALKILLFLFISWLLEQGLIHRYVMANKVTSKMNISDDDCFVKLIHEVENTVDQFKC